MGFSLFPRVVKFFDLLAEQNQQILSSAESLRAIFASRQDGQAKCAALWDTKGAASRLALDLARQLADTFITPIDREDIYALNLAQEGLLSALLGAASRFCLYDFSDTKDAAVHLTANLHTLVALNGEMVSRLKNKQPTDAEYARSCELKRETDALLLVALGELYESSVDTAQAVLKVIKWGQIYDRLEEALTRSAAVANLLQGVSVKNA